MNDETAVLIVIGLILFLFFRELSCWYFKINERIQLDKERKEIESKILAELTLLRNAKKSSDPPSEHPQISID